MGSFIRLFPVEDSIRMNELMVILTKCFDVLYANKKDLSWSNKYYSRYREEELLEQLAELEDLHQNDQKQNPRLAHVRFFQKKRNKKHFLLCDQTDRLKRKCFSNKTCLIILSECTQ